MTKIDVTYVLTKADGSIPVATSGMKSFADAIALLVWLRARTEEGLAVTIVKIYYG